MQSSTLQLLCAIIWSLLTAIGTFVIVFFVMAWGWGTFNTVSDDAMSQGIAGSLFLMFAILPTGAIASLIVAAVTWKRIKR